MTGLNIYALLAHNRELGGEIDAIHSRLTRLEQQARERDAHHEAERQRWHEHLAILHSHLYRLIDHKRDRELEEAAFVAAQRWPALCAPAIEPRAAVTDELNFADLARFHRELPINQSREY